MAWTKLYYDGDLSQEVVSDYEKMKPQGSSLGALSWKNPLLVLAYSSTILYASTKARSGLLFKVGATAAPWLFFLLWKPNDIARVLDFAEYSGAVAEGKRLAAMMKDEVTALEAAEFRRLFPQKSVAQALAEHHRACLRASTSPGPTS